MLIVANCVSGQPAKMINDLWNKSGLKSETKQHLTSGDQHCKYVLVFSRLKLSTILPMVDTSGMESTVKTAAVRKTVQSSMQTSLGALHVVHFNRSHAPLSIKGLSEATSFHQPRNSHLHTFPPFHYTGPTKKLRLVAIGGTVFQLPRCCNGHNFQRLCSFHTGIQQYSACRELSCIIDLTLRDTHFQLHCYKFREYQKYWFITSPILDMLWS